MAFVKGFEKSAAAAAASKGGMSPKALGYGGLALLAPAAAMHTYKAVKEKNKPEALAGGAELAGLGMLAKEVSKAHR